MIEEVMKWLEQAQTALAAGNFAAAATAFEQVQTVLPTDASTAIALANSYRLGGHGAQSRDTLLKAHSSCEWSDPRVAFALGSALLDAGQPHEAAHCFSHTVAKMPNEAAGHGAFAGALRASAKPDLAWQHVKRALALAPKNPTFLLTAAQVRHDLHDFHGAISWLDKADAVRPDHGPTKLQRAFTMLIQGASDEAWANYERRALPSPASQARRWHGEPLSEPLNGGSVLVTAEQGMGDQFQFSRFVSELHRLGAGRVIMECHADAVSLFASNGFDVVARGTRVETDWHVPMMSLPYVLKTGSDTFSRRVPYLSASPVSHTAPSGGSSEKRRRIGIVWAGNPDFLGRASRDLDSAQLQAIAEIPGIEWVSLQLGDAARFTPPWFTKIELSTNWAETAAVLTSLDGLITVDTGMSHLAGAMNVPTWVLVSYVSDWRWGAESSTSLWYPSVQIVRQAEPGDWSSALNRLREIIS